MRYSTLRNLCFAALAVCPAAAVAAADGTEIKEFHALDLSQVSVEGDDAFEYAAADVHARDADETAADYIVIFNKDTSHQKRSLHHDWLGDVMARTKKSVKAVSNCNSDVTTITNSIKGYLDSAAVQGYFGSFTPAVIDLIRGSEDIAIIEKDSHDTLSNYYYLQPSAPWGLGRISHKEFENNSNASPYLFDSAGGENTTIYILDSGVKASHAEFNGRVRWGANYIDDAEIDVVGHGTHVAGSAAGYSVGVSKFANIVSVKVIDADSRAAISNIVQGVSWIIDDHNKNPGQKSVINYSAVGSISEARTYAINQATAAGIMVVTAAGNVAADACSYGPADMSTSNDGVIAVGALNYTNTPASFSNFGACVSVFAPGVDILSCGNDTDTSYKNMSGTSMASPHVAGLASYFWSTNTSYSLSEVKDLIVNYNNDQIKNLDSSTPNRIAYNHL